MGICLMCRAAGTGTGVSVPCDLMPPKKSTSLTTRPKAAKKSPSTSPDDKKQGGAKSGSDQEDSAPRECRFCTSKDDVHTIVDHASYDDLLQDLALVALGSGRKFLCV